MSMWERVFGGGKAGPAKPEFRPIQPVLKPAIIRLPSPNRSKGRKIKSKGKKYSLVIGIDLIVLHATVGTFVSAVDWLRNGKRKNRTSCHYIVEKDGGIVQIVDEADTAWHAVGKWGGGGSVNARSIGIELVNKNNGRDPYPAAQLESTMWLCVKICTEWGIKPDDVVGHLHVDSRKNSKGVKRKTDPARFPWKRFRKSLDGHFKALA